MKRIWTLIAFTLLGCSSKIISPPSEFSMAAHRAGFSFQGDSMFELIKEEAGGEERYRIQYFVGRLSDDLKIEVDSHRTANENETNRLMKEQISKLLSIYDPHRDPYFAILTKNTSCPKEFQLEEVKNLKDSVKRSVFRGYTNERGTWGACTPDLAKQKAYSVFFVCEDRFIKVDFRSSNNFSNSKIEEMISSIQCFR